MDNRLTYTRDGFPWDATTPLFHATGALSSILRSGFKSRKDVGGKHATGGGTDAAVSLTADPRVAEAIVLGLWTLRAGARGELSIGQLVHQFGRECPKAVEKAVGHAGASLGAYTDKDWEMLDKGYRLVHPYGVPPLLSEKHTLPVGSIIKESGPLGPGGSSVIKAYYELMTPPQRAEAFASVFQACMWAGEATKECYNPVFFGTDMAYLARLRVKDLGIVAVRAHFDRVTLPPRAAIDFGYLTKQEAHYHESFLRQVNYDCERHVEGLRRESRWEEPRLPRVKGGYYRVDSVGPFKVEATGKCTASSTLYGRDSMAEVRVYDPSKLQILAHETIEDVWKQSPRRVSYPYFREFVGSPAPRPGAKYCA